MLAALAVNQESRSMDRSSILKLVLLLVSLVLHPGAHSQWLPPRPIAPKPLCASQFALVNHACALLPYVPSPPPSPPSPPPSPPSPSGGRDSRGHSSRHRHKRRGHRETPVEADCCKWLAEVDGECVCDLLVYLPPFLSRPVHQFTVGVGEICNVTYNCGSRMHI